VIGKEKRSNNVLVAANGKMLDCMWLCLQRIKLLDMAIKIGV
jgi:hypothetical protein